MNRMPLVITFFGALVYGFCGIAAWIRGIPGDAIVGISAAAVYLVLGLLWWKLMIKHPLKTDQSPRSEEGSEARTVQSPPSEGGSATNTDTALSLKQAKAAISEALAVVEKVVAHPLCEDAVALLGQALEKVTLLAYYRERQKPAELVDRAPQAESKEGGSLPEDPIRVDKIGKVHFERLLVDFEILQVHIAPHPRLSGIPADFLPSGWFDGRSALCLEYGLDMSKPIPDLVCAEDGVKATLSFGNLPYLTFVPYEAMIAIRGCNLRVPKMRPTLKLV